MVQGAVLAGLTVTEGWSEDLLSILKNGDHLRVDSEKKKLFIF